MEKLNFRAVISRLLLRPPRRPNQGNQDPGERPEAVARQPIPCPGAPLGLGSLDLLFEEAALATHLIAASKLSCQALPTAPNPDF